MKRNIIENKFFRRFFAISLIISLLLGVVQVYAVDMDMGNTNTPGFVRTNLEEIEVSKNNEYLIFAGKINDTRFSLTGTAYCLYDNVNSNKIHIVEKESNPLSNVQVINLEFEENAKSENLEKNNLSVIGII